MNIQRFLLPASIAAAIHVALFLAVPEGERSVKFIEVPLTTFDPPKSPVDPVVPDDETEQSTEPVKPMAGGPTLPDIDESVITKQIDIAIPIVKTPANPIKVLRLIPETAGPGDIGLPGPGDIPRTGIYSLDHLDRIPNAMVQIAPEYPAAMRQSGTAGSVKVEFAVAATGRVAGARVVESSRREFEEPALRAILKWRFEPGKRNGKAVPFRMTVPIEFGIESN